MIANDIGCCPSPKEERLSIGDLTYQNRNLIVEANNKADNIINFLTRGVLDNEKCVSDASVQDLYTDTEYQNQMLGRLNYLLDRITSTLGAADCHLANGGIK